MNRPLPEIALTEEVEQILRTCDGQALLVGRQALAFWAQYYAIRPLGVLSQNMTSDADFLGTKEIARNLAESLKRWADDLRDKENPLDQRTVLCSGLE